MGKRRSVGELISRTHNTDDKLDILNKWLKAKRDEQLSLLRFLEDNHIDMDDQDACDAVYQLFASLNKMHESLPATAKKLANSSKNNVS